MRTIIANLKPSLTITITYKIIIWNDPITFFLGAILGIVLWLLGGIYRLKFTKNDN
jgi:hypothetical protein